MTTQKTSEPRIEPFTIHVGDHVLRDLQQRLANTRLPDHIPGVDWSMGTDRRALEELITYWRDAYDWRAAEKQLNNYDHFNTRIDGQNIHFLHARSKHEGALPLVIAHGWPGSVVEFLDIIDPLVAPEDHGGSTEDAFHVVCPSLPGYGFSEVTRSRGWDCRRIGNAFIELMARLGYSRYGAQGGDWGSLVASEIAIHDKEHVVGLHTNMPVVIPPSDGSDLEGDEKTDFEVMKSQNKNDGGYRKIQGTKPQTLGYALNDSPAGLAAWILEKFTHWTDCNGNYENAVTKDALLTNIMVYWVTGTITSSTRLYYEAFQGGRMSLLEQPVRVPTGIARYPYELMRFPRSWVENHYNVTHWTTMEKGGHFAAMEQSESFVADVRKFFRTVR